ncbi:MAG: hypothetical protein WBO29_13005 [Albidovulum sp.]
MLKVHIHEDDLYMRNLYPSAALDEAKQDIANAVDAGIKNRAPDGWGWTDIYLTQPPAITYASLGVQMADMAAVISPILPRIPNFEVGFGWQPPDRPKETNAYCYGFGRQLFLKLDADGPLVANLWFDARTNQDAELTKLKEALLAINGLIPSIIVDYWLNATGEIDDKKFFQRYLDDIADNDD